MTSYYDTNSTTDDACLACHYSCLNCNGGNSDNCTECPDNGTTHRSSDGSTSCICDDKYYDDTTNQTCADCHYSCATCSTSAASDACDTCPVYSESHRTSDSAGSCVCDSTHFDEDTNVNCVICDNSCLTCSERTENDCLSCPDNATTYRISGNSNNCYC